MRSTMKSSSLGLVAMRRLSLSDHDAVDKGNGSKDASLESPAGSDVLVFEDTDSASSASAAAAEVDPWTLQQHGSNQSGLAQSSSVDSALDELTSKPSQDTMRRSNRCSVTSEAALIQQAASSIESSSGSFMESSSGSFRQSRRANPFAAIVPVGITQDGRAPSLVSSPPTTERKEVSVEKVVEEEEDQVGPSFREFALLSWNTNKLSLLTDETMFVDDGPRQLDAFLLDDVDFLDIYPQESSSESINPKALARFCFPDGLRIRIIPRVALPGAMQHNMVGVGGDRSHILVFTDGMGNTQHGVAITVRHEVPLTIAEKEELSRVVRKRRQRRWAATRICRWWKRCLQNALLKKALRLSGYEQHSVADLRAELSTSELKLLEQSMKNGEKGKGRASSLLFQWQGKNPSLRKLKQSLRAKEPTSPGSVRSSNHSIAEAESLTRNAMKRSTTTTNNTGGSSDGDCASEITDDTELTETSGGSEKKRNRVFSKMSSITKLSSPKSPTKRVSSQETVPSRQVSDWARKCGVESYEAMKLASKYGHACIVEQCYVLLGCRPDEHVLLLGPLQQLVNAERKEINECRARARGESIDEWVAEEKKLLVEQRERRHLVVEAMLRTLRLTRGQSAVCFPRNHLDYLLGPKHFFRAKLAIPNTTPIKLPLPLPSIGKQWALAKLLMDIGPDSLVLMLKLMLLERSILVLGENLEEVTPCACGLLELLEPFEWSSVFLPVLPHKMIDFVTSPVPFVAGMAVSDYSRVCQVENDRRTLDAMENGMSLLNLSTKTLHITSEASISKMLSLDPYLREHLQSIHQRLLYFAQNSSSSIHSFTRFVRKGFSPKESVTLDSACVALENHFSRYCGDLAVSCTAWKQYGTIEIETGKFSFNPDWFMNRLRADQEFHEAMVKTQLFTGYVDERRKDQLEVEQMKRGELGRFIAHWIYERWIIWKERNSPVEV